MKKVKENVAVYIYIMAKFRNCYILRMELYSVAFLNLDLMSVKLPLNLFVEYCAEMGLIRTLVMNKGLVVKKTKFFQLLYVYGHTGGVLSWGFPFVKEGGVALPAGSVSV